MYSEELEIEIVMKTRSVMGLLTKLTGRVAGLGSLVLLELRFSEELRLRVLALQGLAHSVYEGFP